MIYIVFYNENVQLINQQNCVCLSANIKPLLLTHILCYTNFMEKCFDSIIVGGGASGLFAACILGEAGVKVALIEKNSRVGKKLLTTGNGRCNLTNIESAADVVRYAKNYNAQDFVITAFNSFGVKDTLNYFNGLGLLTATEDFCVYPATFFASTVLDVLRQKLTKENVAIFCDCEVREVTHGGGIYTLNKSGGGFKCKNLIMCGGGLSRVAENSCYGILQGLGIKIKKCRPALLPVKCSSPFLKGLNGVRARVKATLLEKGKIIDTSIGEVLFKDYGLSGIVIFQLTASGVEGREISINLLPNVENPFEMFAKRVEQNPRYTAAEIMTGVLCRQLSENVLAGAKIKPDESAKNIDTAQLTNACTSVVFTDLSPASYELSQVTAGGVELDFIEPVTMRCKNKEGLYICGELLDVHGKCGGYNLQFAWTSGALAAKDIIKNLKK